MNREPIERPFPPELVRSRPGSHGQDLKYVEAHEYIRRLKPVTWEHKTAARKYTREQLAGDLQPSAYAYAARETGSGDVGLRCQILLKNRTPGIEICKVERTPTHIREMLTTVTTVLHAVEAGIFYRKRGCRLSTSPCVFNSARIMLSKFFGIFSFAAIPRIKYF